MILDNFEELDCLLDYFQQESRGIPSSGSRLSYQPMQLQAIKQPSTPLCYDVYSGLPIANERMLCAYRTVIEPSSQAYQR